MGVLIRLGEDVEVLSGSQVVHLRTRHERAILAYLAHHHPQPVFRSHLAQEHWPEFGRESALLSLRQRLHKIRQALPGCMETSREWVCLKLPADAIQITRPSQELLTELDFPWIQRLRSGASLSVSVVEPDARRPRQPIRPEVAEEWLRMTVFDSFDGASPYAQRFAELHQRATRPDLEDEERALWSVLAAHACVAQSTRDFAIDMAYRLAPVWEVTAHLLPHAALAYEAAANAAHLKGDLHLSLAFITASERCYARLALDAQAFRLKFKFFRVNLDLGHASIGEKGLAELHALYRKQMTPRTLALLDYNLIFAHANNGNLVAARAALRRSKKHSLWTSLPDENEAVLHLEAGDARSAARCLLQAHERAFDPQQIGECALIWLRAVEVLGRTERPHECAAAHELVTRHSRQSQVAISMINQMRLHRSVNRVLTARSTDSWIAGTQASKQLTFREGHERVIEALQKIAT